MDVVSIQSLYAYHYALHDQLWESIMQLSDDQFVAPVAYSVGSIRNHVVHLTSVDERWLARLLNVASPERLLSDEFTTREAIKVHWDRVADRVRSYVDNLTEEQLVQVVTFDIGRVAHPVTHPVWQILVHMVNHGTDHRAQILPLLAHYGAPTFEQDYMIWLWNHLED